MMLAVTVDDLKKLYRMGSGGDPELLVSICDVLAAQANSPFATAVSELFGLTATAATLSLQERKDRASVHLRERRPKDPSQPSNSALSGKNQQLKIAKLLRDLANLLNQPNRNLNGTLDEDYVAFGSEITIDLRPDATVEAVSFRHHIRAVVDTKWTISVIRDVGSSAAWSVLPGVNVEEIKTRFVPPRLLVIVCLLTNPVRAGEQGIWGFDARLRSGAYKHKEWVSVYPNDRDFLDLAIRVPKGSEFDFRRVELDQDVPGQIDLDSCPDCVPVSRAGVARHRFAPYAAGKARGLVWHRDPLDDAAKMS
jgi:hypothetical protein